MPIVRVHPEIRHGEGLPDELIGETIWEQRYHSIVDHGEPSLFGLARPSGTENIYKIYAESFRGADHLYRSLVEAQAIVDDALTVGASPRNDLRKEYDRTEKRI